MAANDWIRSEDAFDMILGRVLDLGRAEAILDEKAASGALKARATIYVDELDMWVVSDHPPTSESTRVECIRHAAKGKFIAVSPEFFTVARHSPYDPRLWKWSQGIFAFVHSAPGVCPSSEHSAQIGA